MTEEQFWELIALSGQGTDDVASHLSTLVATLSSAQQSDIVDFEYRFREILARSAHYNVMAAAKVVEGSVDDDSFLYFRCRLILEGKEIYHGAIQNPDILASVKRDLTDSGESLLYVADKAFTRKLGEDTDEELPRDRAAGHHDYDDPFIQLEGEDWTARELPGKYPNLWSRYRT